MWRVCIVSHHPDYEIMLQQVGFYFIYKLGLQVMYLLYKVLDGCSQPTVHGAKNFWMW